MTIPSLSIAERGDSLYVICYLRRTINGISVCVVRSLSRFPQQYAS